MELTEINTKCIMILIVPTKCGKNHADISPRYGHTRDIGLNKSQKRLRHDGNIIEIPGVLGILIERLSLHGRHSAALEAIS